MTSRHHLRSDAMPDAAPASRSAMARLRESRARCVVGRRKPPSRSVEGRKGIGVRARRRARAPIAGGKRLHDSMEPIPREIKICELFDAGRLLLRSPERGEPASPREFVEKWAPAGVPVAPARPIAQAAQEP